MAAKAALKPRPRESYGEIIKGAIQTGNNKTGERMSIRELARRVGLSYEQVRKIAIGMPVVSEESNAAICEILGLDAKSMWALAMQEKFSRRYNVEELPEVVPATLDGKMNALWPDLAPEVRERVFKYASALHDRTW